MMEHTTRECSINEASTTKAIIIFPTASLTDNLIACDYIEVVEWGGGKGGLAG